MHTRAASISSGQRCDCTTHTGESEPEILAFAIGFGASLHYSLCFRCDDDVVMIQGIEKWVR